MKTQDDAPLFTAHNMHPAAVNGTAPVIDWPATRYSAYFENARLDQWILWQDDDGVHFAGSDLGWEVHTFSIAQLKQTTVHLNLALNQTEVAWFLACFTVIRERAYPGNLPTTIDLRQAVDETQRPKKRAP